MEGSGLASTYERGRPEVDEAAAGRLQLYGYYRETYAAKPQWQGL